MFPFILNANYSGSTGNIENMEYIDYKSLEITKNVVALKKSM